MKLSDNLRINTMGWNTLKFHGYELSEYVYGKDSSHFSVAICQCDTRIMLALQFRSSKLIFPAAEHTSVLFY